MTENTGAGMAKEGVIAHVSRARVSAYSDRFGGLDMGECGQA